jgi:uncharacterized protein YbaR (Trm112 family)
MREEKRSPVDAYRTWKARLDAAETVFKPWVERAERVVQRYRDERGSTDTRKRRFNILWSNVQVLKPSLYGRKAKPQVSRRFKDQDPVGRLASLILERNLEYEAEQYPCFDNAMSQSVEDRLLPGRGVCWVRYEPHIETESQVSDSIDAQVERVAYERAPVDYVYWKDFSHSPARSWEEVWWVRRRVYMTREEGVQRFGEVFNGVPLDDVDEEQKGTHEDDKKAKVSEIWCKTDRKVYWIADDYPVLLDSRDDPLGLDEFFPCPKPLFATTTNGSLIPVPDYAQYQDQAAELDLLTERISRLTAALRARGVYNGEYKTLHRLLSDGGDNDMIPVDSWAAFAEKGGMQGAVAFLPIKEVAEVLQGLFIAREQVKTVIYEIMGISDIMRGSSDSGETLGAQQLKANFGGLRMKEPQKQVAQYATDVLRLMAQVMCNHFQPQTLVQTAGVEQLVNLQDPEQKQLLAGALELLKSDGKNFRIEVEADSLAQIDEAKEKEEAAEFVTSVGSILKEAVPLAQAVPAMLPLVSATLLFAVRRMRAGRTVEQDFEKALQALQQGPQQDPAQAQAMQEQQAQMQQEGERLKQEGQAQQMKGLELKYGETFAKERISMQQQLAQKEAENLILRTQNELMQRETQLALREQEFAQREQMAKQGHEVRSAVLDMTKKGEGAKVIQMRDKLAELGVSVDEVNPEAREEDQKAAQMGEIAQALASLVAIAQAPKRKVGVVEAPSGRSYKVNMVENANA